MAYKANMALPVGFSHGQSNNPVPQPKETLVTAVILEGSDGTQQSDGEPFVEWTITRLQKF